MRMTTRVLAAAGATLLSTAALVGIATPAYAATLTVGAGQTYTTINAAIAAAVDGDTISVADGTYLENVAINKAVDVVAATPRAAVISGSVAITAAGSVSGFTISNGVTVNAAGAGSTISNNTVTGAGQLISVTGTPVGAVTTISFNTIEDVGIASQPNGVFLNNAASVSVIGNIIRNNGAVPAESVGVNVSGGVGSLVIADNTITGFENAIAVLTISGPPITTVMIAGNTISNTTNSAIVLSNANLSNIAIVENTFSTVGTSGPTRAAVQVGVPGVPAPSGAPPLDDLLIDDNAVTSAPNGVVFSAGVLLADNEAAVVSNNTFASVTGSAIAVDPSVTASVAAPGNDFGGAAVTGNVVVPAAVGAAVPTLPDTGAADTVLIAGTAAVLLLLGTALLLRRRRVEIR